MTWHLEGHILSVYPDKIDGAVIWVIGIDGGRYRITQPYPTTFYVVGELARLENVRNFLGQWKTPPTCEYTYRHELYKGLIPTLAITVDNPVRQENLFYTIKKKFKKLRFYDAKVPFPIRFGAKTGVFPMARCRLELTEKNELVSIKPLESPWGFSYQVPTIRQMLIEPDADPTYQAVSHVVVQTQGMYWEISLADEVELLHQLKSILDEYDPDLIVAWHGDSWFLPWLMEIAEIHGIDFNPSRDPRNRIDTRKAITYHSYGDVHYRAAQTHLYGRWHVDPTNSSMGGGEEFDLRAAVEMARVTSVSVQTAARNSPGSGFTAMQVAEALRRGILVPLHKRQIEQPKSALALNIADSGGLNYRPIPGIHFNAVEIDFFGMYPSSMAGWNISGETVGKVGEETLYVPQTNVPITQDTPGLVASVLSPLLKKRFAIKKKMRQLDKSDPNRHALQAMADGLKWLGYVSFGYQGYKNNLFGNIAAHEAITAIGREMLTRGKEAANDFGFEVIAANTDSLFIKPMQPMNRLLTPEDLQPLIDEINKRTGLIIELEGIFPWIVFMPSKLNPHIGATNRYFGKFTDGSIKVRGLAQRRSDTCKWESDGERTLMEILASQDHPNKLRDLVPDAIDFVRRYFDDLDNESIPLEDLRCKTKIKKAVHEYKNQTEAVKAAKQLQAIGEVVNSGQRIYYLYTHGKKSDVVAWDLPQKPDWSHVHKKRYKEKFLSTAHQILQSLGVTETALLSLVQSGVQQLELWPEDARENDLFWFEQDDEALAQELFQPHITIPRAEAQVENRTHQEI